jgi:hypothetical protein
VSPRYEVQALLRRIGRWWALVVPGLDLHTQCRTLEGAETPHGAKSQAAAASETGNATCSSNSSRSCRQW